MKLNGLVLNNTLFPTNAKFAVLPETNTYKIFILCVQKDIGNFSDIITKLWECHLLFLKRLCFVLCANWRKIAKYYTKGRSVTMEIF